MYKILPLLLIIVSAGCGSIMRGSTQEIPISSNPSGATVIVNGQERGKTPLTVELKRKGQRHRIEVTKKGFHSFETDLVRTMSAGSSVGNILIDFGLISHLVVDKGTGGCYILKPEAIQADLVTIIEPALMYNPPPSTVSAIEEGKSASEAKPEAESKEEIQYGAKLELESGEKEAKVEEEAEKKE